MKTKLIAGILVLAVVATSVGIVSAWNGFGIIPAHKRFGGQYWDLTEEQREELQKMREFKQQICDRYNITRPCKPLCNLTEERKEIIQKVQEFRKKQIEEEKLFWQQICEQYNITCPSDTKFWWHWRGVGSGMPVTGRPICNLYISLSLFYT